MVNRLCLSRASYFQLVQKEFFGEEYDKDFEDLGGWVKQSKEYYDVSIIGFNYFFTIILEIYLKRDVNCEELIRFIYQLEQTMIFTVQEFDNAFIDHLMRLRPSQENTLEEDLINSIEMFHHNG